MQIGDYIYHLQIQNNVKSILSIIQLDEELAIPNKLFKVSSVHEENGYYMVTLNNNSFFELVKDINYRYWIEIVVINNDEYINIIAEKKIDYYKALYDILKDQKRKQEQLGSKYYLDEINRVFNYFRKRLSKTKYFNMYPEDFI